MKIKHEPELRHVLAHLHLAMDSLANGHPQDALYELESVHGLIFFDSDEEQVRTSERIYKWQSAKKVSAVRAKGSKPRGRKPKASRP